MGIGESRVHKIAAASRQKESYRSLDTRAFIQHAYACVTVKFSITSGVVKIYANYANVI